MEYTITGRIYPIILNNIVKNELKQYYKNNEIKEIIKKTKKEYLNIILRTPKMGGNKNIYIGNMYLGAYLIGLFKNINEKIAIEKYNDIIQNGLNNFIKNNYFILKLKMKSIDYLSKKYKRKLYKRTEWARENETKYPWNWQIRIPENQKDSGIYFEFTQCGLCKLFFSENVPELTYIMCNTDYLTFAFCGYKLIRTKTLAQGNECCDFWIMEE